MLLQQCYKDTNLELSFLPTNTTTTCIYILLSMSGGISEQLNTYSIHFPVYPVKHFKMFPDINEVISNAKATIIIIFPTENQSDLKWSNSFLLHYKLQWQDFPVFKASF